MLGHLLFGSVVEEEGIRGVQVCCKGWDPQLVGGKERFRQWKGVGD